MYDSVHYGRLIRDLREKAKMTIEEAAEKYELSMTGLVKIEFGDSDPKLSTIIRIAKVLKMDLGDLNCCIIVSKVLIWREGLPLWKNTY